MNAKWKASSTERDKSVTGDKGDVSISATGKVSVSVDTLIKSSKVQVQVANAREMEARQAKKK